MFRVEGYRTPLATMSMKERKRLKIDEDEEQEEEFKDSDAQDEEGSDEKESEDEGPAPQKNDSGEAFFELSKNRRCTIRSFKGKVLIDLREVRPFLCLKVDQPASPRLRAAIVRIAVWLLFCDNNYGKNF